MDQQGDTRCDAPAKERWWRASDWQPHLAPLWREFVERTWFALAAVALLPVALVIVAERCGWTALGAQGKAAYEHAAVPILAATTIVWIVRAVLQRSRFFVLLAVQALVFTCREIHFQGTHKGVYIATAAVAVWAVTWAWTHRRRLKAADVSWVQVSFLLAAATTYLVSIIIQRRWFKWVPGEPGLHVALEEASETLGHVLFLGAAWVGSWRRRPGAPAEVPSGGAAAGPAENS